MLQNVYGVPAVLVTIVDVIQRFHLLLVQLPVQQLVGARLGNMDFI